MLLHKTPNYAKFCRDRLKNAGDIRDRNFVLPEKVGQSLPTFYGMLPPKTSHHFKFRWDRSNQLGRKVLQKLTLGYKKIFYHGRTETWLLESRACERHDQKMKEINARKVYRPVGKCAERAKWRWSVPKNHRNWLRHFEDINKKYEPADVVA